MLTRQPVASYYALGVGRGALSGSKCNEAYVAAMFPDPIAPRSVVARWCDLVRARAGCGMSRSTFSVVVSLDGKL
jgi:hypothetical protein